MAAVSEGEPSVLVATGSLVGEGFDDARLDASVVSEPLRDIIVVWEGDEAGQLSMNVKIDPLISFAWGGFLLLLQGTALAAWPNR